MLETDQKWYQVQVILLHTTTYSNTRYWRVPKTPCSTKSKPETIRTTCLRHSEKSYYCQVQLNMWPEAGAEITTQTSCVCKHFLSPMEEEQEEDNKHRRTNAGIDYLTSVDQKDKLKLLHYYWHTKQLLRWKQLAGRWSHSMSCHWATTSI